MLRTTSKKRVLTVLTRIHLIRSPRHVELQKKREPLIPSPGTHPQVRYDWTRLAGTYYSHSVSPEKGIRHPMIR